VEGNLDAVSAAGEPSRGGVEEPLEVELERFGSRIECPLDLIEDGVRCLEREAQILGRKTVFRLFGGEQRLDRARPLGPDGGSVLGSGHLAVTGGGEGHQRATVASVDGATADVARLRLALAEVARQAEEALEEHLERAPIELLDQAARHRVLRCDDELEEDDLSPAARGEGGDRSEHLQAERCRDAASGTCLEDMREHREVVRERVGVWTARVPLIGVDSAVAQGMTLLGGRVQDELAPLVAAGSWFDQDGHVEPLWNSRFGGEFSPGAECAVAGGFHVVRHRATPRPGWILERTGPARNDAWPRWRPRPTPRSGRQ
jgi:hypothetical protein